MLEKYYKYLSFFLIYIILECDLVKCNSCKDSRDSCIVCSSDTRDLNNNCECLSGFTDIG